jgi:hypothetical protein
MQISPWLLRILMRGQADPVAYGKCAVALFRCGASPCLDLHFSRDPIQLESIKAIISGTDQFQSC